MEVRDGRVVASENEVRVLRALHRFGWLRTRDIAALLWQPWLKSPADAAPTLSPPEATPSGQRMAQRTLRRLAGARQLLRAQAPNGSVIYTLAEAGARRLRELGISAISGKDLIRGFSVAQFQHRRIANEIAIRNILSGFRVSTEREIARDRWVGGAKGIGQKKPDVLLQSSDGKIFWCEIERTKKNSRDYSHLLQWLQVVKNDVSRHSESELLGKGLRWGKIVFVCRTAFQSKLCRDLETAGWDSNFITSLILFEPALYSMVDRLFM
jgi:hypothetical protein